MNIRNALYRVTVGGTPTGPAFATAAEAWATVGATAEHPILYRWRAGWVAYQGCRSPHGCAHGRARRQTRAAFLA
jgi:hypothetical protein